MWSRFLFVRLYALAYFFKYLHCIYATTAQHISTDPYLLIDVPISRYREASKYSLETGALQKALDYAYKEVDLGRCIVGTESEYLDKDAQDADTWVKHLQKERFRNLRQFWERGRF